VHAAAIPDRKLKDGDIFSIDVGMRLPSKGGMVVDMATTVKVGKVSKKEVEFLESEEVERIIQAADGEEFKSLRDRSILELLFSSGLRVSELVGLNRDRLDLKKQEFAVRGKGDKN